MNISKHFFYVYTFIKTFLNTDYLLSTWMHTDTIIFFILALYAYLCGPQFFFMSIQKNNKFRNRKKYIRQILFRFMFTTYLIHSGTLENTEMKRSWMKILEYLSICSWGIGAFGFSGKCQSWNQRRKCQTEVIEEWMKVTGHRCSGHQEM